MEKRALQALLEQFGKKYSEVLQIDLKSLKSEDVFKWFLASLLFGAPIGETSALRTFECFRRHGILSPEEIVKAGWQRLVEILDEGGYTRYDFKTSDKLLEVMNSLITKYGGDLNLLHQQARDSRDLEERVKALGKGSGDVTTSIFLRDLRGLWSKADPLPTDLEVLAARNLGLIQLGEEVAKNRRLVLEDLKRVWRLNMVEDYDFANLETALVRIGKNLRRKGR